MKERSVTYGGKVWRVWCPDGQDVPEDRAATTVECLLRHGHGDTLMWQDGMQTRITLVRRLN